MSCRFVACVAVFVAVVNMARSAGALDLVVDGQSRAVIVVEAPAEGDVAKAPVKGKAKPVKGQKKAAMPAAGGDAMAAEVLAEWLKKMTGAEVPVVNAAVEGKVAIYVGQAAVKAGLDLKGIESATHEGVRVVCDGKRVLIGGQNGTSTVKAVCRFLEELGCRYYMDHPMGEVYLTAKTLVVKEMDLREKPGFAMRQIWGSNWGGNTLWKIWNGAGGIPFAQGHSWGAYVDKGLFETHPEYFALRNGERKKGDWYCTSSPELRKIFAEGVIKTLEAHGGQSASISPPDGVSYCECDKCKAQDDPASIEPSSGKVCVTDRYVDFFNAVAKQVGQKFPEARLSFYCYADYTQAPTRGMKLEPNLVAWIAPLRYCRMHAIGSEICPSRAQLAEMIDGWSKAGQAIAYRTYNYNLAECLVPYSMLSVWGHDVPYLKAHGAVGINLESLASWQIYGPHMYASLRLAYDPAGDVGKIQEDYFANFYGPKAGPIMKRYWLGIDRAFAELHAHAGSFFAIHKVYTLAFLAECRKLIDEAMAAVKDEPAYLARVAMHGEGLKNAEQHEQMRVLLNAGKAGEAREVYQALLARTDAQTAARYGNHYTSDYLKRFIGKEIEPAAAAIAAPNKLIAVLPDQWKLMYDEGDKGVESGFAAETFDDAAWKSVATYSDTLDGQGMPDRKTIMWYRTTIDLPAAPAKGALFFVSVDGLARVFVNGQEVGSGAKKRLPFEVEAAGLKAGKNVIAVRVDHSGITELFLGGIVRPVYLVEKGK